MSIEENKRIVRAYVEAWGTSDPDKRQALFDEALAPDFTDAMPAGRRTRAELVDQAAALHERGSKPAPSIDQLVAEDEWVAVRNTFRYTDVESGEQIEYGNPFFARVVDGQMIDGYGYGDQLGVLIQTGKLPPEIRDVIGRPSPTVETLKAIAGAFNRHDLDAIMEFFADDAVLEMPRGQNPWGERFEGKDAVRAGLATRFEGMPDVQYDDDRHWVCGNLGVSEWTLTGTTTGGQRIEVRGCDHWTFRDGKVIKKDSYWKIVDK